jgi:hypothetical protein
MKRISIQAFLIGMVITVVIVLPSSVRGQNA